mmetsp:Transcript_117684/g.332958  ORF Transcript_117684/g.332958 Transcript_117684/m.332958 type:complete len:272 (-) Transcript_117684:322-1137(-)
MRVGVRQRHVLPQLHLVHKMEGLRLSSQRRRVDHPVPALSQSVLQLFRLHRRRIRPAERVFGTAQRRSGAHILHVPREERRREVPACERQYGQYRRCALVPPQRGDLAMRWWRLFVGGETGRPEVLDRPNSALQGDHQDQPALVGSGYELFGVQGIRLRRGHRATPWHALLGQGHRVVIVGRMVGVWLHSWLCVRRRFADGPAGLPDRQSVSECDLVQHAWPMPDHEFRTGDEKVQGGTARRHMLVTNGPGQLHLQRRGRRLDRHRRTRGH